MCFDFDDRKAIKVREWVRDLWDEWFDEVYPPSEEDSEAGSLIEGAAQQSVTSAATLAKG